MHLAKTNLCTFHLTLQLISAVKKMRKTMIFLTYNVKRIFHLKISNKLGSYLHKTDIKLTWNKETIHVTMVRNHTLHYSNGGTFKGQDRRDEAHRWSRLTKSRLVTCDLSVPEWLSRACQYYAVLSHTTCLLCWSSSKLLVWKQSATALNAMH